MSSETRKFSVAKAIKSAARKLYTHGRAGPHSSKKGKAGYSRKVKHKNRENEQ